MQPIDGDSEIGAREQRRGVAVEADREQGESARAERDLSEGPLDAAPEDQAERDGDQQQARPPQRGESSAAEQVGQWLAERAPQRDVAGDRRLCDGAVQRADQQSTPATRASLRARLSEACGRPGCFLPKSALKTSCHASSVPNRTLAET